jgi:hypothetical protein
MIDRAHGCSTAYANCELRFAQLEPCGTPIQNQLRTNDLSLEAVQFFMWHSILKSLISRRTPQIVDWDYGVHILLMGFWVQCWWLQELIYKCKLTLRIGRSAVLIWLQLTCTAQEQVYLDTADIHQLSDISDEHQRLCTFRGLGNVVAEILAGPHAVASPDLDEAHMRALIYHDHGNQKFSARVNTRSAIEAKKDFIQTGFPLEQT